MKYTEYGTVINSKGFTLVEFAFILIIIALLASIGIPQFLKWAPNIRLKAAAQNLLGDMQLAKLEAIKRNAEAQISFTTVPCGNEGGGYVIFLDNVTDNNTLDAGEPVIKQIDMPEDSGVCAITYSGAPGDVGFQSNGLPTYTGSVTIQLQNTENRTYNLEVSAAGNLSLN